MKLSLDALKEKAEAIASEELLNEITGGNAKGCHTGGFWDFINDCLSIPKFM